MEHFPLSRRPLWANVSMPQAMDPVQAGSDQPRSSTSCSHRRADSTSVFRNAVLLLGWLGLGRAGLMGAAVWHWLC